MKDIEFPDFSSLASTSVAHIGSQFTARFRSRSASAHKAYVGGILELTKPVETDGDMSVLPLDHVPLLDDEGPLKDYRGGNDWPRPLRNDHLRLTKEHFISWEKALLWGITVPKQNWSKGRGLERNTRADVLASNGSTPNLNVRTYNLGNFIVDLYAGGKASEKNPRKMAERVHESGACHHHL